MSSLNPESAPFVSQLPQPVLPAAVPLVAPMTENEKWAKKLEEFQQAQQTQRSLQANNLTTTEQVNKRKAKRLIGKNLLHTISSAGTRKRRRNKTGKKHRVKRSTKTHRSR